MSTTSSRSKIYLGVLLLLSTIALLTGCTPDDPQSTFDTVGPVSRSQLVLFYWIFWAAMVVWVIVGGALSWMTGRSAVWGSLRMVMAGGAAAAVTFGVGSLIGTSLAS